MMNTEKLCSTQHSGKIRLNSLCGGELWVSILQNQCSSWPWLLWPEGSIIEVLVSTLWTHDRREGEQERECLQLSHQALCHRAFTTMGSPSLGFTPLCYSGRYMWSKILMQPEALKLIDNKGESQEKLETQKKKKELSLRQLGLRTRILLSPIVRDVSNIFLSNFIFENIL